MFLAWWPGHIAAWLSPFPIAIDSNLSALLVDQAGYVGYAWLHLVSVSCVFTHAGLCDFIDQFCQVCLDSL